MPLPSQHFKSKNIDGFDGKQEYRREKLGHFLNDVYFSQGWTLSLSLIIDILKTQQEFSLYLPILEISVHAGRNK